MELTIEDAGNGCKIAALHHVGNSLCLRLAVYTYNVLQMQRLRINILNSLYEPLQYPFLFPHGSEGWGLHLQESDSRWTQREYYKFRLLTESRFCQLARLGCEHMCDMFSRMEDERFENWYLHT